MTSLGFDVSVFNGHVNYSLAKSRGIEFVLFRAGFPSKYYKYWNNDALFLENYENSLEIMPSAAYFVFRPQWDGNWQADKVSEMLAGKALSKRVGVDVELNEFNTNKTTFQNRLKACVVRLENNGYLPFFYTRASFWNPNVGNPTWASNYALWIARYGTSKPWYSNADIYRPYPWYVWDIWQYSADGNNLGSYYGVESSSIDLNKLEGDVNLFFGSEIITPPSEDEIMHYKVNTGTLNVRKLPLYGSPDIGDLKLNDVVAIIKVVKDIYGNDWGMLGLSQYAAIKYNGTTYMTPTDEPINRETL